MFQRRPTCLRAAPLESAKPKLSIPALGLPTSGPKLCTAKKQLSSGETTSHKVGLKAPALVERTAAPAELLLLLVATGHRASSQILQFSTLLLQLLKDVRRDARLLRRLRTRTVDIEHRRAVLLNVIHRRRGGSKGLISTAAFHLRFQASTPSNFFCRQRGQKMSSMPAAPRTTRCLAGERERAMAQSRSKTPRPRHPEPHLPTPLKV